MNRSIKTFLVWLLMAILPLHALAAGVGMSCAPGQGRVGQQGGAAMHQAMPAETMQGMAHGMAHSMAHNMAHDRGHDAAQVMAHDADGMQAHHGVPAEHAGHAPADGHGAHDQAGQQHHSSCSACSALCVGAAAPPPAILAVPAFDGSDAFLISPATLVPGFIPDGLQRPPRPRFA